MLRLAREPFSFRYVSFQKWMHKAPESLPSDLGWIAPPVCPDLIYYRHSGANPSIPDPGSRRCIRRDIYPPRSIDRHRDRPTSPRSPWQNAYAERLIGSIRRECLDHIVVFGEHHLRPVLLSYMDYYNGARTHLSLNKDAPISRCRRGIGTHSVPSDPRWTAPPICSGLICGSTRGGYVFIKAMLYLEATGYSTLNFREQNSLGRRRVTLLARSLRVALGQPLARDRHLRHVRCCPSLG
jgi:hypothetical protein